MKIQLVNLNELPDATTLDESIGAIGFFDGVHLGHQRLINTAIDKAKNENIYSSCITFKHDPYEVIKKISTTDHLNSLKTRLSLIENLGVDIIYLLDFDKKMASLKPEDFIKLLKYLKIKSLCCGPDFRFGEKGSGNPELLNHYLPTTIVPFEMFDQEKISSSIIEKLIMMGNIEKANEQLGYYYFLIGEVIHGNKVGRTINFPTANLKVNELIIPKSGIYLGYAIVEDKIYKAMINIGYNPTINKQEQLRIEAYLLDFNEEIYGEIIQVGFIKRLRDEIKFNSKDELVAQLYDDKYHLKQLKYNLEMIKNN